jgi:hypothetical protein
MKKLDEAYGILTELREAFADADGEEEIEKEDSEMSPDEITKMIDEKIAEAVAKATTPTADSNDSGTPAAEALTMEGVQKMIEESIAKAFEDLPKAQLEETQLEGVEPITKEAIEQMIVAAMEPVLKARGLPSNLNGEQEPIEKGEADVFDGFFI